MMAPQFVKPYVKSNKNDAADAEAICEAVQRPGMRFVPGKRVEQQDLQSLHRVRSQWVARRTAQANQVRGLLSEYGIVIPKGVNQVRKALPLLLENAENSLSRLFREMLSELYDEMVHLDQRIAATERKLAAICAQREDCQRLLTIPGVGLLTATALIAAVGDITAFNNDRELAAWLGLVLPQYSTGGKPTLLGHQQAGRYLPAYLADSRRALGCAGSVQVSRSAQSLDRQHQAPARQKHCQCRCRQQECADCLGVIDP